jgi:hypothetical protein
MSGGVAIIIGSMLVGFICVLAFKEIREILDLRKELKELKDLMRKEQASYRISAGEYDNDTNRRIQ